MPDAAQMERAIENSTAWIAAQRWFGDKSRTLSGIRIERFADLADAFDGVALAVVRCTFETGSDALYFMPAGIDDPAATVCDSLTDGTFLTWWFSGYREGREIASDGTWSWRRYDRDSAVLDRIDADNVRMMSVEQSNSSALFDNQVMIKIFRRLQPGVNPDLEVTRYLTTEAGFTHVPALYGTTQGVFDGQDYDMAVVQAFVPNRGDCWSWLGTCLHALSADTFDEVVDAIGLLGQRTGELHVALARDTNDPAFAPEGIDAEYAAMTVDRVRTELVETAAMLMERRPDDTTLSTVIDGLREQLSANDAMVGLVRTRVHGDYHLGQVLRTVDDDFAIIDFEGEPLRPIEYRREKASPLRDVAGMLRSLGYAAGAMRKRADGPPEALLADWATAARAAYIERYRAAIAQSPAAIAPSDPDAFVAALNVLEIEKALYEARYEMNNRPDWLDIPLDGLRNLATSRVM